jgi:heme-degrading monooxygenase HmoA
LRLAGRGLPGTAPTKEPTFAQHGYSFDAAALGARIRQAQGKATSAFWPTGTTPISNRRGDPMSIIRLIHIQLDPSENEKAEQVWKTECAPLMIQQKGCLSEKLLRAKAAGEFISYSEWESEQDIERYMKSDAHKEIVRHSRGLKGTKVVVKLYDLVK